MTLGEGIIAELGRRGARGQCFDYRGYHRLRAIDSAGELRAFLVECGYADVPATAETFAIVDELLASAGRQAERSAWPWLILAPELWLVALFRWFWKFWKLL
jgi:hypothetical protein